MQAGVEPDSKVMPRLFVAIDLSDEIKSSLVQLCSGVTGAKWVRREHMHLTLRFIGDVDTQLFETIREALSSIRSTPFDLSLQGVGQFPTRGAARVLWIGLDAPPLLSQLQRQIEAALVEIGIKPEARAFSPHITLARLKTPPHPESIRQFLKHHADYHSSSIPIHEFALYSSVLAPDGSTYHREAVYPLQG